jgi:hypothetical protein
MLDQTRTMLNPNDRLLEGDYRVRESARRLFERLNPIVRDRDIAPDTEPLAIYDWEIANDTKVGLGAVRSALRVLNGTAVVVQTVNEEHRVTALTD